MSLVQARPPALIRTFRGGATRRVLTDGMRGLRELLDD